MVNLLARKLHIKKLGAEQAKAAPPEVWGGSQRRSNSRLRLFDSYILDCDSLEADANNVASLYRNLCLDETRSSGT